MINEINLEKKLHIVGEEKEDQHKIEITDFGVGNRKLIKVFCTTCLKWLDYDSNKV